MSNSKLHEPAESIAIIGMRGRFPGARNLEQFWQNLRDGVEAVSFFSDEELLRAGVDPSLLGDPNFVKAGGRLEDVDLFDAVFFGFSARDAEILDPQQRLFLECASESLEDAGYNPETYPGMIGVYAGTSMSTYLYSIYAQIASLGFVDNFQLMVGNDKDYLTTLVSYKLNLKGPSVAVQTACSTSLVAVCMACQSLLNYQCDIALAGGSTVSVPQNKGYYYQQGGILSPDGYCRTFDAAAQGTVGGNGVGIVVLKRLSEALADGDHIYAVIKGSALNNDGSLKVGFTAPSVEGQAQVVSLAQAAAKVDPETITYVEAHGTATPLGDPIEIAALTQAFGGPMSQKGYCAIGSVKSNVGHLDSAAGVAGLIKTVLALQHKMIPPSLHFNQPNAEIDFENSPFYVNNKLSEWHANGTRRRAGVSSFGIGGTNAHVVLEESPAIESSGPSRPEQLLLLSAKTSAALETATDNLVAYLKQHPAANLADVAYTYQVGRRAFKHRRMLVSPEIEDATRALESRDPQRVLTGVQEFSERPVLYMFPGQGTQYVDMGRDLYDAEPVFQEQVDYCSKLLRPYLGFDLREALYPRDEYYEEAVRLLGQTAITQPALFTMEYALAKLWMQWGVHPQAMIGHSIGEYVAACLSGVFTLEEALALVAIRGQLMEMMPAGIMLAVPLSEAEMLPLLNGHLSLAAVNAPSQCVLSGPAPAIEEMAAMLGSMNLPSTVLHTSHAFHSSMMEPIVEHFVNYMQNVNLNPPQIPFLSNVTGTWITAEQTMDPNYWGSQLRHTVRFADGLQELLSYPEAILLEVGPGQTLGTLARYQQTKALEQLTLATLHSSQEPQPDVPFLLKTVGRVWLAGVNIDWDGFYAHEHRHRLSLPTYPFEYQRYWVGPPEEAVSSRGPLGVSATRDVRKWLYVPTWTPSVPVEPSRKRASAKTHWLVFHDAGELGGKLVERLKESEHEVTSVVMGEQFAKLDSSTFTVRPDERADYDALLLELQDHADLPKAVVHLWSVTANEPSSDVDTFEHYQSRGFYSLLYLAQALTKLNVTGEIPIGMVSNQLQSVLGDELLNPAKATVPAACKVISQEYPALRCRSIDVSLVEGQDRSPQWLAERLIADLTVEPFSADVAYRKGLRWVRKFEALQSGEADEAAPTVREGGVYLITGGLGNIGLTLAEHLATTAKAKLVLIGRSAFPQRDEWEQRLASHIEDETARKIRKLQKLEELGAEIMVARADASDLEQMRSVIDQTYKRFGDINGLIHGAGNVSAGSVTAINETDRAACERHFNPKAKGLLVLEELLRGKKLDFCLLLSSLSSILGGLGFVAYAAANNFMDAFANEQNQAKETPWISVNWDGWQFSEDGSEQAASLYPTDLILPREGMAAFQRILDSAQTQVVVSVTDLQTRIDQWVNLKSIDTTPQAQTESQTVGHARPNLSSQYVAPTTPAEETIVEVWQQLLGVSPIGIHDNFFELGGHSLLAIQLISRIRNTFELELPVQKLFETPTVAQLAESIEKERAAPQQDNNNLAEVLGMVEGLSEDEVRELLAGAEE